MSAFKFASSMLFLIALNSREKVHKREPTCRLWTASPVLLYGTEELCDQN
ncbi:unnamed protein product [Acanthoscelides obtectus]|uniref:Uncharacterized protein n=1 Tax=Acanthoscelides obtectus TaxID=200917 RepID=A0A9P0PHL3_ACAOB|nr:unnamed protein product [Acanthoscelides obtectus]CAK1671924.1 hypothetical protein AOBTE_LOCUS28539 [Acanthoscelides obtectus]